MDNRAMEMFRFLKTTEAILKNGPLLKYTILKEKNEIPLKIDFQDITAPTRAQHFRWTLPKSRF